MAAGWQIGARCLPSIELAGVEACSSAYGMTNAGLLSCTGYSVSNGVVALSMSDGSTANVVPMDCDRMTYTDTWGPLFVVIVLSVLAIWCARKLIDMFTTDTNPHV